MNFRPFFPIPDVVLITPTIFEDDRGFFMEIFQAQKFKEAGLPINYAQDNHSRSKQGTLRGLHYQIQQAQGKLIRTVRGEIFDVAVDIRKSSPTFGKWVGTILSEQSKQQLWIPAGFAHGFYVISDWAEVIYKATDFYAPQHERSILWNDPDLNIDWHLVPGTDPLLSNKDANGTPFSRAEIYE